MLQKDIHIGCKYMTKVSGTLGVVVVVGEKKDAFSGRTKFIVRREFEQTPLSKSRSAAALRPCKRRLTRKRSVLKLTDQLYTSLGRWMVETSPMGLMYDLMEELTDSLSHCLMPTLYRVIEESLGDEY